MGEEYTFTVSVLLRSQFLYRYYKRYHKFAQILHSRQGMEINRAL